LRDGGLRERAVGHDHFHLVVGEHGGGAPVDLDDPADEARIGIELDEVAHLERPLHLDRDAREEVAERVLERETDHGREERRRREQARELYPGHPQGGDAGGEVHPGLEEVPKYARERALEAPRQQRVGHEHERAPGERDEQEEDLDHLQRLHHHGRRRDERDDGLEDHVDDEEHRGRDELLALPRVEQHGEGDEQPETDEQPEAEERRETEEPLDAVHASRIPESTRGRRSGSARATGRLGYPEKTPARGLCARRACG
jgi:hypothetical protein